VAIIGLLLLVLRSPMRVVRIIAPLAAAVITVTALCCPMHDYTEAA